MLRVKRENADEAASQSNAATIPGSNDRDLIDDGITLAVILGVDKGTDCRQARNEWDRYQAELTATQA